MTLRACDWQGLYYMHSSLHSFKVLHICTVKMSRWHRVSGYVYKLFSTAGPFISNPMGSAVRKHFLPRFNIPSYIITYYLSILILQRNFTILKLWGEVQEICHLLKIAQNSFYFPEYNSNIQLVMFAEKHLGTPVLTKTTLQKNSDM